VQAEPFIRRSLPPASTAHCPPPPAQRASDTVLAVTPSPVIDHQAPPPPAQRASSTACRPRLAMPVVPTAGTWPVLLLLAVQVGVASSSSQPWRCAPCSAEKLALCPLVPASCRELSKPAGCGCCPMCALPLGAACGVATARCAQGLSCRALPGEPRPLHALTRGQGACVPEPAAPAAEAMSITESEGTAAPLLHLHTSHLPRDTSAT
jgi:hypothetical protein